MGKKSSDATKKNAFKPNGFNFFLTKSGSYNKRSSGMPRPNSFLFPVKREVFNIPRPNGFMFPQTGKRASGKYFYTAFDPVVFNQGAVR